MAVISPTAKAPDILPISGELIPSPTEYGVFTRNYGTITSVFESTDQWDIVACSLEIVYTLDMSAYVPRGGTSWTSVGVTKGAQGRMSSGAPGAFRVDDNLKEPDDQLVLESPDRLGEAHYDVLDLEEVVHPPIGNPQLSYGIWFDRDGVSASEAGMWGAVDGSTYNTGGVYQVAVMYHSLDHYSGTMFATVNGLQTGFYDSPRDAPPDYFPVGKTFSGDQLSAVHVYATVNGSGVVVRNLTVTGCLTHLYVEINVLPDNPSNCLQGRMLDTVEVAILGSYDLDIRDINPATLEFEGLHPVEAGSQQVARATHVNEDEYTDLMIQFDNTAHTWSDSGQPFAVLTGQLWDYTPFEGTDMLCRDS